MAETPKKSPGRPKKPRKPGRPRKKEYAGLDPAARQRAYRARKKAVADFEGLFAQSLEILEAGAKVADMLAALGLTWPDYWRRVRLDDSLRARYLDAIETRDALWQASVDEALYDRALHGYREDAATPKGQILSLHKTDGNALIRLYNDRHVPKQATALSGALDINAALADAVRAADADPPPSPSPAAP